MGKLIGSKRATSRRIIKQFAVFTLTEQEEKDRNARLRIAFQNTDALSTLNVLAQFSIQEICKKTNVLQERRKLYDYFLKHIRNAARMNQLEISIEQTTFVERNERAVSQQEAHLKRAQEESAQATLRAEEANKQS